MQFHFVKLLNSLTFIVLLFEDMVRGRRVTSSGGRGEDSGRRFDPTQQASGSGPLSPSSLPAVGMYTSMCKQYDKF